MFLPGKETATRELRVKIKKKQLAKRLDFISAIKLAFIIGRLFLSEIILKIVACLI
jgi:hypothetical protein